MTTNIPKMKMLKDAEDAERPCELTQHIYK